MGASDATRQQSDASRTPRMIQGSLYKRGSYIQIIIPVARCCVEVRQLMKTHAARLHEWVCLLAGHKEKAWRARYFILQPGQTPCLIHYRKPQAGEPPASSLPLKGASVTVRSLCA